MSTPTSPPFPPKLQQLVTEAMVKLDLGDPNRAALIDIVRRAYEVGRADPRGDDAKACVTPKKE